MLRRAARLPLLLGLGSVLSISMAGCSPGNDGSQYIGKWERIEGDAFTAAPKTIEFSRHGDSIVWDGSPLKLNKEDNTLSLTGLGGTITFSHSKQSDTVLGMGMKYKRVN